VARVLSFFPLMTKSPLNSEFLDPLFHFFMKGDELFSAATRSHDGDLLFLASEVIKDEQFPW